jgi:plasmid stabilization system protein ParE
LPEPMKWIENADPKQNAEAVAAWRSEVESALPNLLTEKDIGRMQHDRQNSRKRIQDQRSSNRGYRGRH